MYGSMPGNGEGMGVSLHQHLRSQLVDVYVPEVRDLAVLHGRLALGAGEVKALAVWREDGAGNARVRLEEVPQGAVGQVEEARVPLPAAEAAGHDEVAG